MSGCFFSRVERPWFGVGIVILMVVFLILSASQSIASDVSKGRMKLLAVSESSKGMQGSIADLSLEIRPGEGRVFLETFPPTKEDTQISMRFAKQVACARLDVECGDKDFIYTIRAGPGIVGGPSAGAAAAALTMSVLSGTPMRDDVAMTGTINSGGIVGPVGGLKSKIKAAAKSGMKIALIPFGTRKYKERLLVSVTRSNQTDTQTDAGSEYDGDEVDQQEDGYCGGIDGNSSAADQDCEPDAIPSEEVSRGDGPPPIRKDDQVPLVIANFTIPKNVTVNFTRTITRDLDLVEYGRTLGIEVREVSTLDDALMPFTGKNYSRQDDSFTISQDYVQVMRNISADICGRTDGLALELGSINQKLPPFEFVNASGVNSSSRIGELLLFNESLRLIGQAENSTIRGDYYTAASFCFRANIALATLILAKKNLSKEQADEMVEDIERGISALRTSIQTRGSGTITDLQASMIVLERLDEGQKILNDLNKAKEGSNYAAILAYVDERVYSARAWSRFLGSSGSRYAVDERALQSSCQDKLTEAQERYEYVNYYIPNSLAGVRLSIERATALSRDGGFQRCLHMASLAKAEADLIGSLIGANKDSLSKILDLKLSVVKSSIVRSQALGSFPILAYSYYEYANSLRDSDLNSALLFAEYAIELSNLDMYFDSKPMGNAVPDRRDFGSNESSMGDLLTGASIAGSPETGKEASGAARSFVVGFILGVVMMLVIAVLSRVPKEDEFRD